MTKKLLAYYSKRGWQSHLKSVIRKKNRQRLIASAHRHYIIMKHHAEKIGRLYRNHSSKKAFNISQPPFSSNIKFLTSIKNLFTENQYPKLNEDHLWVPVCFSLLDNYEESFKFLKMLFVTLYKGKVKKLTIDYKNCTRIDVDASICMDVILAEFINYRTQCRRRRYMQYLPGGIFVTNYKRDEIEKVLFSIGAFKNLKGLKIDYTDVEPLSVLINPLTGTEIWSRNELHLTNIVDHIKRCLTLLGKELSSESETKFYKVIGEVMSNAEEHSTIPFRYAIGFFQKQDEQEGYFGVYNFCIFNFGDTIYQTFKSPNCRNPKAVNQMEELSAEYTKKGWFRRADFEEETLWTLYALQEGVTSRESKRGNGSIQYIENFFNLRGVKGSDNTSKMVILSGNSRILFDGNYPIVEKAIPGRQKPFKMITFNPSGKIEDKPDENYVSFAPHYFPGTLISARILIKSSNINTDKNGHSNSYH